MTQEDELTAREARIRWKDSIFCSRGRESFFLRACSSQRERDEEFRPGSFRNTSDRSGFIQKPVPTPVRTKMMMMSFICSCETKISPRSYTLGTLSTRVKEAHVMMMPPVCVFITARPSTNHHDRTFRRETQNDHNQPK
jgi:hypothetical protein